MSFLTLEKVSKSFGTNTVVKEFNLGVRKGEFVSFLGPSGCGKTTVLRMVAGFETPTAGAITIDGQDVTRLPANKRRIGMVFQAYALFPNMNVYDNVAFGLKISGMDKSAIDRRVKDMLDMIALGHLADRYPYQMSGGQQQRVALARALAPQPQVLLLDEPLSALDAKIRVSLREDIRNIQRELGITTVFVTHDQEEALSISDRVIVMNKGRADQIGTPAEIYNRPKTRFVAEFVGTLNMFEARVTDASTNRLSLAGRDIAVPSTNGAALTNGETITLALRPEALFMQEQQAGDIALEGRVQHFGFHGSIIRAKVAVNDQTICVDMFNQANFTMPNVGENIRLYFSPADALVLAA
ncbi:ABC transporter ATP-binding protein [Rhizobium sp. L1K21]|uniref:ABC transporter ATP-binding protein n=1 Tax=Rhizobium sp. L1K21 TaxID=2954933 RepID=UPI002092E18E|nr:ABC transporter ATP-binding protein [Rhizobium sp. L1K21]MCO6185591.1 ABC transporter ATP-binding protein [Rhizobium sp. L1K21]